MGLRITTWNVNGIRNPFGYQPWRDRKTFEGMFDTLEADIVIMQETKIQRKDLTDDMVLVPGWDVYFSLPKHKKGYSGVAIYTRNAVCAPIRAEEGITGVLCPPNSSRSFFDLPITQQIGGYPSAEQLSSCPLDSTTLDSEGRCVVLEFPAFVLIGVYSPANRDESRDDFRLGFLNALDARVRNLVAAGKRVVLTGDLNIIRSELDTANAEEQLRKYGMTGEEYFSTPARRLLNQLLLGGKVIGERDEGREKPALWDICRGFHPGRKGMFTCWETKINARPGNFGSRIDYVLCSLDMKDWICDSNIQEGLIGSDHCPVYATIKDMVDFYGSTVHIRDIMNPPGMFKNGVRLRDWNNKDLLPLSAKQIPEFDRRRNIRDMFTRGPTITPKDVKEEIRPDVITSAISISERPQADDADSTPSGVDESNTQTRPEGEVTGGTLTTGRRGGENEVRTGENSTIRVRDDAEAGVTGGSSTMKTSGDVEEVRAGENSTIFAKDVKEDILTSADSPPSRVASIAQIHSAFGSTTISPQVNGKRSAQTSESRPLKRGKSSGSRTAAVATKGQSSLRGFFKPKSVGSRIAEDDGQPAIAPSSLVTAPAEDDRRAVTTSSPATAANPSAFPTSKSKPLDSRTEASPIRSCEAGGNSQQESPAKPFRLEDQEDVIDPIVAKETWSRLLSKRVVPRCEHNEPCVSYLTKKAGVNCGRSFYMCPRPLGPSGQKEKNTQWRCGTFIWSSDWTGDSA